MDELRKITIKPFIEERVKGITHAGKVFYPLYLRVTYLNKGTMIKVLDKEGNNYYIEKDTFEVWDKSEKRKGLYTQLESLDRIIKAKALLFTQVIKLEYIEEKDRFDFKRFTKKIRAWEKSLFYLLYNNFIDQLRNKALDQITNLVEFNKFDFNWVIRNENQTRRLFELINIEDKELLLLGRSLLAYHYFEKKFIEYVIHSQFTILEKGNVFYWFHGGDRASFLDSRDELDFGQDNGDGFFSAAFMEAFRPIKNEYPEYQNHIDKEINFINEI